MNNVMTYSVYKTLSGLYVAEEICELYNVGDDTEKKLIKGIPCYKVNEKDINTISEIARREGDQLIADIVTIFDLQLVLSFTVYRDINHDNKLYVSSITCDKYGIRSNTKRIIKNQTYYNVTEDDITQIELKTKAEKIAYKRKYIDIELDDEMKPADYLFICYVDFNTKKNYIKREMYELLKQNNIEVEGIPKIIYGKNCYSITEKQLKEAEKELNYRRVEQLLRPSINPESLIKGKMNKVISPKMENLQKVIAQAKEYAQKLKRQRNIDIQTNYNNKMKEFMDSIVIEDDDPTDDVDQYKERLKAIMDTIVIDDEEKAMNEYNEKFKKIMDSIIIEDDDPTDDVDQYKEKLKNIMESIVIDDDVVLDEYNQRIQEIMDTIVIDDDDPTDDVDQYKERLKAIMDSIVFDDDDYEERIKKIMDSIVFDDDVVDNYNDRLKKIMDTIVIEDDDEEYNKKLKEIMDSIVFDDDNVDEYKERIQKIMDTIVIDDDPQEKVIIYKDKKTNKLYGPISENDNPAETINIMHKQCKELTEEDLESMNDKEIITVSVFPIDKKEYDIIICNNNGQLYISKNNLEELGFYIENPHRISVNKEIYEEINEDDLELIKSKESDSCHINIIMKQITPKRG